MFQLQRKRMVEVLETNRSANICSKLADLFASHTTAFSDQSSTEANSLLVFEACTCMRVDGFQMKIPNENPK